MAMRTLGEALESALASILESGESATAIAPLSRTEKRPEPGEAPASFQEALPVQNNQTSRRMTVAPASPKAGKGSPAHAAVIRLVVDNERGSGPAWVEGGVRAPGRLRSAGGNAREWVKLVHSAGSLSETG